MSTVDESLALEGAMNPQVGYFDHPQQTEPTYDPGLDISCWGCGKPLNTAPRVTISVAYQDREKRLRSYFYRMHKRCHGQLTIAEEQRLDSAALEEQR